MTISHLAVAQFVLSIGLELPRRRNTRPRRNPGPQQFVNGADQEGAEDFMQIDAAAAVQENIAAVAAEPNNVEVAQGHGQGPSEQNNVLQNGAEAAPASDASTPSLDTGNNAPAPIPNEQHVVILDSTGAESLPEWARAFIVEQTALMQAFRTEMMEAIDSAMNRREQHGQ